MNDYIELHRLFTMVLRKWWLLILVTAFAAALGYTVGHRQAPVYEARATLLVGQIFESANLEKQDLQTSELVAQTYSDLTRRQPILQSVVDVLGLNKTWQQLRKQVRVGLVEGTQLIQITAEADSPDTAQMIADEVAHQLILFSPGRSNTSESIMVRQFIQQQLGNLQARIENGQSRLAEIEVEMVQAKSAEQLSELQRELNTLASLITSWENTYTQYLGFLQAKESPGTLTIIESAQVSPKPINPQVQLIAFLATGLGFLLALGFIFLLGHFDDTLKTAEEISQVSGLPVLGMIRKLSRFKNTSDSVYVSKNPRSPAAEDFRILRANLELLSTDQPLKTILVTSCDKATGKSFISTNLAMILAHSDREIILIDADLRNSNIHKMMSLPNEYGLSDVLKNGMNVSQALRNYDGVKGGVITGGTVAPNPFELLGSKKMDEILAKLKKSDYVIIDSPPLFVSDSMVLSSKVDGVLLVAELSQTKKKQIRRTVEQLNRTGAQVIGVVLNRATGESLKYYGAKQYVGYGLEEADEKLPIVKSYLNAVRAIPNYIARRFSRSNEAKLEKK